MEPEIKRLDELRTVLAFTSEAEEMEFYRDHRDWLLDLMARDIPHVQRIRHFQAMILLWRGFKEGRLAREWNADRRRWHYHPPTS
jgi:hypothetical protein